MAIEVFSRYEKKYLVPEESYASLLQDIENYMELDSYNQLHGYYTISNLYYDTWDSALIRTSLQKPKYKEKIRLRAYGVPGADDMVFLEMKKKVNGLVNKRRTSIPLQAAYPFLESGKRPPFYPSENSQVLRELAYSITQYHPIPKVYIAYDRRAYFASGDHGLRLTFDTNIRTRRYDLRLEAGDYGSPILSSNLYLMEVKAEKSIPTYFSKLLSKYCLCSTSFSKYGTEYLQYVQTQRKGVNTTCSTQSLIHQMKLQYQLQPSF